MSNLMSFLNLGLKFSFNNSSDQTFINFSIDDVIIKNSPDTKVKNQIRNQCAVSYQNLKIDNLFQISIIIKNITRLSNLLNKK